MMGWKINLLLKKHGIGYVTGNDVKINGINIVQGIRT